MEASPGERQGALARLLHEVRQPLSGIESIAYYLEIALESEDEEIRQQCSRIRTMVRQANWLLDDASIGAGTEGETSCLNEQVFSLAERLALHEERSMELRLAEGRMPVAVSGCALKRIAGHVLSFLHDVAEADEPVDAATLRGDGWCSLRISGRVDRDKVADFGRMLAVLRPGGLAGVMAQLGGQMEVLAGEGLLEVDLRFPVPVNEVGKSIV